MAKRGQGEGSISKRPDGTWCGRITVGKDDDGKQKRKAFYGRTRAEVQAKMAEALDALNKNVYMEPSKMTVSAWMDIWLKEYKKKQLKPSTYGNYRRFIDFYLNPYLGTCRLVDLRGDMVQKCVNSLQEERGLAPGSIARLYRILNAALEDACKNELIPKNPARYVALPRKDRTSVKVLTAEEQHRFIQIAKETYLGELFILILGTGMRIGECLALC